MGYSSSSRLFLVVLFICICLDYLIFVLGYNRGPYPVYTMTIPEPRIYTRDFLNTPPEEARISKIDLDVSVPFVDEIFERLVLVTAFSSNHFNEGLGFIEFAQRQMPNKTIIVYDIGLKEFERKRVTGLCSVQLRRFPFSEYPTHFRKLKSYAFKPTIINLALDEFGVIYYGDASIRFRKSVKELIPAALKHHGFLGHIRCFDPKTKKGKLGCNHDYGLTREEVYPILGVNRTELYNSKFSVPAFSGGLMLLVNSTYIQENLMKPWKRCAADKACIAPHGASINNHRFDQSALTIIAYKNLYKEFTLANDPTKLHESVARIKRGKQPPNHPQRC